MTLLHQAAQKAVERIRHTLMTGLAHNDAIAALGEIVAMLPQHPDPETRPSMSMFASAADYNAAMDEWLTPPALQHQEVPREPVALTDKQIQDAVFAVLRKWNTDRAWERYTRESGPYDVSSLRPEVLEIIRAVLAASPSTTRQQEVGSGLLDNETFRKGIREDGTVEGYYVETYYLPCKAIGDDDGFLRVVVDDNATDAETRVPHSALISAGWVRAAAPSTPENAGGVQASGEAEPTIREQTLAGLVKRLAWLAPKDHAARIAATECLQRYGYLSPLRADVSGLGAVVSQTPPPLGTDGGTHPLPAQANDGGEQ